MKITVKKFASIFLLCLVIFSSVYTYFFCLEQNIETIAWFSNIVVFLCMVIYRVYVEKTDMNIILILFAWAFSIGAIIPEIYGFIDNIAIINSYDGIIINKGMLFVAISMSLYVLGAIVAKEKFENNQHKYESNKLINIDNGSFTLIANVMFWIGIVPMLVYIINCLIYVVENGYGASIYNDGVLTDGSFFISFKNYFVIAIYMLVAVHGKDSPKKAKVYTAIGIMYCICMILVGIRLTIIAYLIGLLFCYHYCVESLLKYKKRIVVGVIIAILILPVLSSYRLIARNEWTLSGFFSQVNPIEGLFEMLSETGNSMKPLLDCMSNSHLNNMNLNGSSYLYAIALTFMFSSVVKAVYNPGYSSLQRHYTQLIDPAIDKVGGGLGFSMFAEAYLNFHMRGVIIMGILGFIFTYIFEYGIVKYKYGSKIWLPISLFLCQRLLFYVRSDSFDFYGNFKLMFFIVFLGFVLSQLKKSNSIGKWKI